MSYMKQTGSVICSPGLLSMIKADHLLHLRGTDILNYLSSDITLLKRRNKMFADLVHIKGLDAQMDSMLTAMSYIADMVKMKNALGDNERGLYSVKEMEQYFEVIDSAEAFYSKKAASFTSEDYLEIFTQLHNIAVSDEYQKLKAGTAELLGSISRIKSVSVGFNLDASLSPAEAGILSVNEKFIESGYLIDRLLRMSADKSNTSIAPLLIPKKQCKESEYETLNYALYSALNKLFKRQIKQWEPEIDDYISTHLAFLLDILPDLQFISEMSKIQQKMIHAGLKLCVPEYHEKEEKIFVGKGIYNPVLALTLLEKNGPSIVKNDLTFDRDGTIYILTGPNNGGKSEFLTSVCITQILAQLGVMVPADSLTISPVDAILLDFPKFNALNEKGRLAEECAHISEMFKRITPYSLCFLDEAFSSTDVTEAIDLSLHVLRALSHIGTKCIYSTHFHQLINYVDEINQMTEAKVQIDFLVAGIGENEMRTYKIHRKTPDGKSYAKSIADNFGINYHSLIEMNNQ